jgi:hypothetical protein
MRKLTLLLIATLLIAAPPALAQRAGPAPNSGDIQAYGGPWRYQHRDWSRPGHPLDPGVCWYWNDRASEWKWEC